MFALFASTQVSAQDVIVKKDGTTILSKVVEVGSSEIKYKKHSHQDGPTYSLSASEILSINYENGEKEIIEAKDSPDAVVSNSPKRVVLKKGISVPIQIVTPVKARDLNVGDQVAFKVAQDIFSDGIVVIPNGTPVKGTVYVAKKSSAFGTKGKLGIIIKNIDLPDGGQIPLMNGDIFVTGHNRTALSLLLFLFVTMPAAFICGSKAQIPSGYEIMATVANPIVFSVEGNIVKIDEHVQGSTVDYSSVALSTYCGPAMLAKKDGEELFVDIQSIEDSHVIYKEVKTTIGKDGNIYKKAIGTNDIYQTYDFTARKKIEDIKEITFVNEISAMPAFPFKADIYNAHDMKLTAWIIAIENGVVSYTIDPPTAGDTEKVKTCKVSEIKHVKCAIPESKETYGIQMYTYIQIR